MYRPLQWPSRGGGGPGCVCVCPGGCLPRVVVVCVQGKCVQRVSAQGGLQGESVKGCVCVSRGVYTPPRRRGRHPPPARCMLAYTHSPVNRMTDRCKNITLPQTSFVGGKNNSTICLTLLTCAKPKDKMEFPA